MMISHSPLRNCGVMKLYDGDMRELYGMAWHYVRKHMPCCAPEMKWDAVQEIVAKCWKRWNYDASRASKYAYFSKIAGSAVADIARREKWNINREEIEKYFFAGGMIEKKNTKMDIVTLVIDLKERDKMLYTIALLRSEGYNDKEIAAKIGLKSGVAVRAYVKKHIAKFREGRND